MRTMNQPLACSFRCAQRTLHGFIESIRASLEQLLIPCAIYRGYEPLLQVHVSLQEQLVGCAMRTMNQPLATSFRCARRTLHGFIELIRASLGQDDFHAPCPA
jgi:hypothetical protein